MHSRRPLPRPAAAAGPPDHRSPPDRHARRPRARMPVPCGLSAVACWCSGLALTRYIKGNGQRAPRGALQHDATADFSQRGCCRSNHLSGANSAFFIVAMRSSSSFDVVAAPPGTTAPGSPRAWQGLVVPYIFADTKEWAAVARDEGARVVSKFEKRTSMGFPTFRRERALSPRRRPQGIS